MGAEEEYEDEDADNYLDDSRIFKRIVRRARHKYGSWVLNVACLVPWTFLVAFTSVRQAQQMDDPAMRLVCDEALEDGSETCSSMDLYPYSRECCATAPYNIVFNVLNIVGGTLGLAHVFFHFGRLAYALTLSFTDFVFLLETPLKIVYVTAPLIATVYAYQHLVYFVFFCRHDPKFCDRPPDHYGIIIRLFQSFLTLAILFLVLHLAYVGLYIWTFLQRRWDAWIAVTELEDSLFITDEMRETFEKRKALRRTYDVRDFVEHWTRKPDAQILASLPHKAKRVLRVIVDEMTRQGFENENDVVTKSEFKIFADMHNVVQAGRIWDLLTRRLKLDRNESHSIETEDRNSSDGGGIYHDERDTARTTSSLGAVGLKPTNTNLTASSSRFLSRANTSRYQHRPRESAFLAEDVRFLWNGGYPPHSHIGRLTGDMGRAETNGNDDKNDSRVTINAVHSSASMLGIGVDAGKGDVMDEGTEKATEISPRLDTRSSSIAAFLPRPREELRREDRCRSNYNSKSAEVFVHRYPSKEDDNHTSPSVTKLASSVSRSVTAPQNKIDEKKTSSQIPDVIPALAPGRHDTDAMSVNSEYSSICIESIEDILYDLFFRRKRLASAVISDAHIISLLVKYLSIILLPICAIIITQIFDYEDAFGEGIDLFKTYAVIASFILSKMQSNVQFLLQMLTTRPFNVGDVLELDDGNVYGVDRFDTSHTFLTGRTSKIVSNEALLKGSIRNLTRRSVMDRLDLQLPPNAMYDAEDGMLAMRRYMAQNRRDIKHGSVRCGFVGANANGKILRFQWRYKFAILERDRLLQARTRVCNAIVAHANPEIIKASMAMNVAAGGGSGDMNAHPDIVRHFDESMLVANNQHHSQGGSSTSATATRESEKNRNTM